MSYAGLKEMNVISAPTSRDATWIRSQFPALDSGFVYLENAGGSQVPASVIHQMSSYMRDRYVQLGARYPQSLQATETVERSHQFANRLMNGEGVGKTIIGASSTTLIQMLAASYGQVLGPGDEIIVAECGHEANIGAWLKLAERGITVKLWSVNREAEDCTLELLESMLGPQVKLVAFPHVSNLLGRVWDVRRVTSMCHSVGARVIVDGVAYAPHRAVDVQGWGVDWYLFSTYKVYGPHGALMFGRDDAFEGLVGPNHYFVPNHAIPEKFEPGGVNHESAAGLLGTGRYLSELASEGSESECSRDSIERAFEHMALIELSIQQPIIEYLLAKPGVRIVGPSSYGQERVPTISFLSSHKSPSEIVHAVDSHNIGIRYGHMYSKRLCEALGIDSVEGVVRISAVHYNSIEEVRRLIETLDTVL